MAVHHFQPDDYIGLKLFVLRYTFMLNFTMISFFSIDL